MRDIRNLQMPPKINGRKLRTDVSVFIFVSTATDFISVTLASRLKHKFVLRKCALK